MSSPPLYAPFIVAPPLTCCTEAYLTYGQGTPPYDINILATGDANGTSLETIPRRHKDGVLRWRVDFNEGANITFALTDGNGQQAYSQYRVVQAGEVTTCSKTDYSSSSSSKPNLGAILGGVLGALFLLSLALLLIYLRRRRLRKRRAEFLAATAGAAKDDDFTLTDGPAGVMRAGTFNLGNVRFTEASLDRLRENDRPPNYDEARAVREEREAAAAAAAGGGASLLPLPSPAVAAAVTGAEVSPVSAPGAGGEGVQQRLAPPVPVRRREREAAEEDEGEMAIVEVPTVGGRSSLEGDRRRSGEA